MIYCIFPHFAHHLGKIAHYSSNFFHHINKINKYVHDKRIINTLKYNIFLHSRTIKIENISRPLPDKSQLQSLHNIFQRASTKDFIT